jgi:hypothetical protein
MGSKSEERKIDLAECIRNVAGDAFGFMDCQIYFYPLTNPALIPVLS